MNIELRRLSHLVALADARHFARAADAVHLSQSAFSRSIQSLEEDVGQRLFDRDTGELRPTPAGEFLIERARRLLFEARCLHRDLELYRQSELGDCAFGAGPFPAVTLMPRVLPALRAEHPQVRLRVEVSNWEDLLAHLRAETLDFFVADVRALPTDATLEVLPLPPQPAGFYARPGHSLLGRPCTLHDIWNHGLATVRLPAAVSSALAALLGRAPGQDLGLALECDHVGLLRTLALTTDTVLGTTHVAVREDVVAGRLLPLDVQDAPPLAAAMGVVSLRNRSPSPMARKAIARIQAAAAEVNAEG